MRLFIMRHGPAEAGSPSGGDFDRPLSAAGREVTSAVARELSRRGESPSSILSSPLVRAVQTAELVQRALPVPPPHEIREELAPSADATALIASLRRGGVPSALLVGHSPDVGMLVASLLGHHVGAFEAAMIVSLELGEHGAIRRYVISPQSPSSTKPS